MVLVYKIGMIAAWIRSKLTLTRTIIAVNIGIALTSWALIHFGKAGGKSDFIHTYFPLQYRDMALGKLWEVFSYMWVHLPLDGVWSLHLLINMVMLATFGRLVEDRLGPRTFALVYFGGGIFAALCALLEMSIKQTLGLPGVLSLGGASGGVAAVIAAFAWIYPEEKLIVVPIPVPVSARKVVFWMLGISWLLLLTWPQSFISHSAHIGGLFFGLFTMWLLDHPVATWGRGKFVPSGKEEELRLEFEDSVEGWEDDRLRAEADRVLEKIHRLGMESLTGKEKMILDRARHLL